MNWRQLLGVLLIAAGLAVLVLKLTRVYDPVPAMDRASARVLSKASPGLAKWIARVPVGRVGYAALVVVPWFAGVILLFGASPARAKKSGVALATGQASRAAAKATPRPAKKVAVQACNVLQVGAEASNLWQFDARNGGFILRHEQTSFAGEALPVGMVAKDWRSLYQPRLNIAWLPPEQVFLRVAQFPQSEFKETLAMVELQLEKLSPMPVAQIVWSLHVLPQAEEGLQTVIVMIVARSVVEEFLGKLEGQGFLADRLELPILDQLSATPITADGAWIYPEVSGGKNMALVAWWYGGVLHNLDLITASPSHRSESVKEQLMQMAWAGELEGWLNSPPQWHLVAHDPVAGEWEPILRQGLDQGIQTMRPLSDPQLAALTAKRAAYADPKSNLLPVEYSTRYQQQFVDRLWMRGLLALAALYVVGVVIYFVALEYRLFLTRGVESEVAKIAPQYTNAVQLKALYRVLQDRHDLQFAALDCWKKVAELMPDGLTLDSWNFVDGKRLTLSGTGPSDGGVKDVLQFEGDMRKARGSDDQLMFTDGGESTSTHLNPGSASISWNFSLILRRVELE